MNIFIFTAANAGAQQHLETTIKRSVDENRLKKHLTPEQFKELSKVTGGNGYFCWGATPGPNNERNWGKLEKGDKVLSYWNYSYHHFFEVLCKFRNKPLARELWGTDNDGETW